MLKIADNNNIYVYMSYRANDREESILRKPVEYKSKKILYLSLIKTNPTLGTHLFIPSLLLYTKRLIST